MSTPQLLAARRQLKGRLLLTAPAMLVLLVFLLAPLAIMFLVSILQSGDYGGVVWGQYSLDAYINFLYERDLDDSWVFNTDYLQIFQRSLLLSLLTTAGCLLIGFPTALYLALQSERKRNLLLFLVTVPFWTNLLVRVYAWILLLRNGGLVDAGLQGIGLTDTGMGLLYTDNAVIIGLLYTYLPFMVLPIYSSLEKMDWRLVEAAFDLGANRWKALRRVIVQGTEAPLAERRAALEPLAQPGRSFRPLAAEQLAYLLVEEGKTAEAITALQALVADQEAPGGLRSRASQMIVALGGELAQG